MDDAGQRTEPRARLLQCAFDAVIDCDIAREDFYVRTKLPERAHAAQALRSDAFLRHDAENIVPFGSWREFAPREQRELDLLQSGEMFGDLQGNAAEAASDDVDPAIAQPGCLWRSRGQTQSVQRLHPTGRPAKCHESIRRRRVQLVEDRVFNLSRCPAQPQPLDIDATCLDLWRLSRRDEYRADECRTQRVDGLIADLREGTRQDTEVDCIALSAECANDERRHVERGAEIRLEILGSHARATHIRERRQAATVDHVAWLKSAIS